MLTAAGAPWKNSDWSNSSSYEQAGESCRHGAHAQASETVANVFLTFSGLTALLVAGLMLP